MKRVAVVIPCHNYGHLLGEAIESALAQSRRPDEILVVDDGSTDDTAAVAARYPVTLLRHERARGAAAARNTGWRASCAELIAFLDADDVWLPAKLERQLARLAAVPDAGLVYCDLIREERADGRTLDRWSRHMPPREGWVWREELMRNFVQTSSVLAPRAVLEETGGFDETFTAWEDIDLWVRIARHYPYAYVPEPLVRYRMHAGLSTRALAMAKGRLRATRKAIRAEPVREPWMRRLLASCYGEMGVAHYLAGEMPAARRWLWLAVRMHPAAVLERPFAATYAKTLLGGRLVGYLRARRRPGGVS